ncbi:MFS transporter [Martelella lutilitoris]|uniref:MFS transporter n=1 Tax=Martelella lutilitoris TaxID=2583532 RepID=A0A5C4JMW7_9HYPH|nr:MFS transporter [Martelella lutilitoris]TNB46522.1 MFS transporter [Martelella lutilitoris]
MLFDWAAQPFFTVIITFIFGPYFVSELGSDPVAGQTAWAHAATIAGILVAIGAPFAGALSDSAGRNKRFIGAMAVVQAASLALLWFAAPGTGYFWPAVLIIAATVMAELSVVFNDAMLPHLVRPARMNRVSNEAWGLGYLGGMIFLIAVVLFLSADPESGLTMLGLPPLFGLDPETGSAARLTGPLAAGWYFLFLVPFFIFTPDRPPLKSAGRAVVDGVKDLNASLVALKGRPVLIRFLIARMLYMDGVNGILILGGAFAAGMFGWKTMEIGIFGIILNVAAIFGCFLAPRLGRGASAGSVVLVALVMLVAATLGIVSTTKDATLFGMLHFGSATESGLFAAGAEKAFLAYGLVIGLAFGPVQAGSRAFLATRVSPEEAGRFFGLFSLTGRMTSFMATGAFAILTGWTGSPNLGMASLLVFLVAGLVLFVPAMGSAERRQ